MPSFAILAHLGAALAAVAAVLVVAALPKGTSRHRAVGRIAAGALMATAATSFFLPRFGTLGPLHLFSALTLVSVPWAVWAARRHRGPAHRLAMTANAVGLFGAGFGALAPGRFLSALLFG